MRILITTHQLSRGGKEKQLIILAQGLNKKGHQVEVLSTKNIDISNYYHEYNFPLEKIRCLGNKNIISGFIKFKQKVLDFRPDVIITFDIQSTIWAIWLQWFKKSLFINYSIQRGTPYSVKAQWMLKYCANKSTINIANSRAGFEMLGLKEGPHNHIIYNSLDLFKSNESTDFNSIFGTEKATKSCLIINTGSISKHKGQHTIIEALKLLNDNSLYVIFLGDGPYRHKLEAKIEDTWMFNNVKFMGRVDNVEKYLRIADLYIHSSKGEGTSNAIIEALLAKLPVLTTNTGGTKEIIEVTNLKTFNYDDSEYLATLISNYKAGAIKAPNIDGLQKRYFNKSDYVDEFIKIINSHL